LKKLLISTLVFMGCTAKLEYLSIDKEFTPHQLKLGYLLVVDPVMDNSLSSQIVNVKSADVKQGDPSIQLILDSESQVLGKILVDRVRSENEKLKVDSLEKYQKIHASAVQSLKQHIKDSREIPEGFINSSSETFLKFPNPFRFLATVRIEDESKSQDFFTREEKQKNEKGEIEYVNVEEWRSYRKMTARMQVYDLKLKKQVFDGIQTRTASSSREKRDTRSDVRSININFGSRDQYPPFPDRKEVFSRIANDFADNLPNEEDD